MSENIQISIPAGRKYLLETAGKICDKNIVINAGTADMEGTAIPRGEIVKKIYFNTNNTAEETFAILNQLTYEKTPLVSYPINVIYGNTADGVTGTVIYAIKYSDTEIAIQELQDMSNLKEFHVLYSSETTDSTTQLAGFGGWNFTRVLGFNPTNAVRNEEIGIYSMSVYAEGQALTDFNGIPIGTENEKIKNVLSITPYAVISPKGDPEGTAITAGEETEMVYFNINNTLDETVEVLRQLPYIQTPFLASPIYPIFAYVDPDGNGYTGKFLFAVSHGAGFEINYCDNIATSSYVYLFNSYSSGRFNGWSYSNTIGQTVAKGVPSLLELGVEGLAEWNGLPVGTENEKLRNVLSSTPFAIKGDDRYDEGVEAGKKAEYDAFWDTYQQNGNRTNYRYAFYSQSNNVWDDKFYNPKYPITAINNYGGDSMYQGALLTDTKVDIEIGVNASYTFIACYSLKTIRKLIVSENTTFNRWFGGCEALENVTFEGIIANDISFADSLKLSNASVQSIIDHLKDFTGQTGKTLTLHAYVGREVTEEQKATITAKNWTLVY